MKWCLWGVILQTDLEDESSRLFWALEPVSRGAEEWVSWQPLQGWGHLHRLG